MLTRLAATAAAWPRRLAALGLLAFIVLAVFGAPAIGKLSAPQAFNDPASQSALAVSQIQRATGHDAYPEIVVLVKAPPSSSEVRHAAAVLRTDPAVASITLAPPVATSPLVSRDGQQTLIPAVLRAAASQSDTVKRLTSDFRNNPAVLLDAFLVRSALAPAVMRPLGTAAWWSPRPLRRLHERIGLRESPAPVPAPGLFPPERSPA